MISEIWKKSVQGLKWTKAINEVAGMALDVGELEVKCF